MKLDWSRIKRTFIQSASGAGVALVTALAANFNREAVIAACVEFASTVLVAVLMNINKQAEEAGGDE